jgi:rare lipoprotein A
VQTITPAPPPVEVKSVPAPAPNKVYRIQVGSYKIAKNAVDAFERLKKAGLNPVYERNGEFFRVVLSGIRAEDVESVTQRIGTAGFRDPLLRAEN